MTELTLAAPRSLERARTDLEGLQFSVHLEDAPTAREERHSALRQIDDYLLPRLGNLGAPALAVLGGPTGSGKSTLLNSLLQEQVSAASSIRPTTKNPVLVASAGDAEWFLNGPVLPGFKRAASNLSNPTGRALTIITASDGAPLAAGLALLDAPDIDSIEDSNRQISQQLLDAADLWLFVTTAARYADLAAWQVLAKAASRGVNVAVILNRLPGGVEARISADLSRLLEERGLAGSRIFPIPEVPLRNGLIPTSYVEPLALWLKQVAVNQEERDALVRATLAGAIERLAERMQTLALHRTEQETALATWSASIEESFGEAANAVLSAAGQGALLRNEVLSRWQDVIGTSDAMRTIEGWVGSARDRLTGWLRGAPQVSEQMQNELTGGLVLLLVEQDAKTRQQLWSRLQSTQGGQQAFGNRELGRPRDDSQQRATETVRRWQGELLELVRQQSPEKRQRARYLSLGLNTVTVALMVAIFTSTGGLLGGEIAVAGGSAILGQKLLETVFGDQAVRRLSQEGLRLLEEAVAAYFAPSESSFSQIVESYSGGTSAQQVTDSSKELARLADELR